MSWIFVDGINEDALYETLDLAVTGEAPDPHDLVPAACLWRELLSSPGGARYSQNTRWSWTLPWVRTRRVLRGCRQNPDVSHAWSWSMRWSHTQVSGKMAASLGKFDMTPVKEANIWRLTGISLLRSQASATSQRTSGEPKKHAVNMANGTWTMSSMCHLTQQPR